MLKIILLGAIQGLTEFFPVSSSGHLVITQHFLNVKGNLVTLDIALHLGTLAALFTYLFRDIIRAFTNRRVLGQIFLVTLITGMIGVPLKKTFESLFTAPHQVAALLIINGIILSATVFFKNRERVPGTADSVIMGIAQGLAIAPGISRSGLTISSLLMRGVKREEAFRFSFIASIPAILGAFLLEERHAAGASAMPFSWGVVLVGVLVSYGFGLIALRFLNRIIRNDKFHVFGYYCLVIGTILYFI